MSESPSLFKAGRNIAMKVPPHQYEQTVRFYRDVLGLPALSGPSGAVGFAFGASNLWIDRVPSMSQAEIWLEVVTEDLDAAEKLLAREGTGVVRCDEIEPLEPGFAAFWIASPASIVHLVCQRDQSWSSDKA
jgi:catechol 2,3-dioxygenase-like lactoylglutathione lyase family enzyme